MPLLTVSVTGNPDPNLSNLLASKLTDLTNTLLGKDPSLTAVAIRYFDPDHWFIGGRALSLHNAVSFSLHISVTEGTNTKSQIAAYIAAVFTAASELLGGIRDESYIVVDEVPAASWGYAGKTQEFRFIAGSM